MWELERLRDAKAPKFGWRLVAMDRERETSGEPYHPEAKVEELPYGMQIAEDGCHLIENPAAVRVLTAAAPLMVDDMPVSGIAARN